jgi:transcription antitermination factor NusG
MPMNWFVLYTTPRAEKQVEKRIAGMCQEVFLPVHQSPRKWTDRIKLVEMPLFPSYIFVKTTRENLYELLKVPGVTRIVYYLGKPAEVRQSEIDAIHLFLEKAHGYQCHFDIDDEVKIAFGPLTGRVGKVKTIRGRHVVLILNHLGLHARVELDKIVKK